MDKITMGDRIRDVRKKRDLTQEQLAEKLDITISYLSEIERGLKLPSFPLFLKIVEVLDVSADYLIKDTYSAGAGYGDKFISRKLETLSPKQRIALEALIDTYIKYLD